MADNPDYWYEIDPSSAQLDYIDSLCERLDVDTPDVDSMGEASELIDEMKDQLYG